MTARRSPLRSKCDSVLFWVEIGNRNFQSASKFEKFKISQPANAALNAGDYAARRIPSSELANRSEFLLRPAAHVTKLPHLRADDVARGVYAPVPLSSFPPCHHHHPAPLYIEPHLPTPEEIAQRIG